MFDLYTAFCVGFTLCIILFYYLIRKEYISVSKPNNITLKIVCWIMLPSYFIPSDALFECLLNFAKRKFCRIHGHRENTVEVTAKGVRNSGIKRSDLFSLYELLLICKYGLTVGTLGRRTPYLLFQWDD